MKYAPFIVCVYLGSGHNVSAIWGRMIFGWAMKNSAIPLWGYKKIRTNLWGYEKLNKKSIQFSDQKCGCLPFILVIGTSADVDRLQCFCPEL